MPMIRVFCILLLWTSRTAIMADTAYPVPQYIAASVSQSYFVKWLNEKAWTLFLKDKRRGRPYALAGSKELYKDKIYAALVAGGRTDPFTGEALRWDQILEWDPSEKNKGRGNYLMMFPLVPTVDHKDPYAKEIEFEICSWIINSCKNDQTPGEFVTMCRDVKAYRGSAQAASRASAPLKIPRVYLLPDFLTGICTVDLYSRWLDRHATTLFQRDHSQGRPYALAGTRQVYKKAMHAAICANGLRDPFTGEIMRWDLISTWDPAKAKDLSDEMKQQYNLLPTIDHVDPYGTELKFEICSWRINRCKSTLTPDEFVEVCRKVANKMVSEH